MAKPMRKMRGHTRSCGTKQGFDTLEEADKASRRPRAGAMEAYKCKRKKCGKYHFGHVVGVK